MKKLIAIIALITIALSVGNIVKAKDFNRDQALIIQKHNKFLVIGDVGPQVENHSKVENITIQVNSTKFINGPETISTPISKDEIKLGGAQNNIYWCGLRPIPEVWLMRSAQLQRQWTDLTGFSAWGADYLERHGRILIKNSTVSPPQTLTINFMTCDFSEDYPEALGEGWISVENNSNWSIKKVVGLPSSDYGTEKLELIKVENGVEYKVEIYEGLGRIGKLNPNSAGAIILHAKHINQL